MGAAQQKSGYAADHWNRRQEREAKMRRVAMAGLVACLAYGCATSPVTEDTGIDAGFLPPTDAGFEGLGHPPDAGHPLDSSARDTGAPFDSGGPPPPDDSGGPV